MRTRSEKKKKRKRKTRKEVLEALTAGVVTRVSQQRRDPERVSVYIDGAFAFGLKRAVAVKAGLAVDDTLSVEAQRQLLEQTGEIEAKGVALEYLAFKPRTRKEVRDKLLGKGYSEDIAASCVERFAELGYLDDASYARIYTRDGVFVRRHGLTRIARDLSRRGVPSDLIDEGLAEVDHAQLLSAARKATDKRLPRLRRERDPRRRKKKLYDFLRRRGFRYDIIRTVLDDLDFKPHPNQGETVNDADDAPTKEETLEMAHKRWDQLMALERSSYKRQKKLHKWLARRGVPSAMIRDAVDAVLLEQQEAEEAAPGGKAQARYEEALELARGRWRRLARVNSNVKRQRKKLKSWLARQGFRYDVINRVIDEGQLEQ